MNENFYPVSELFNDDENSFLINAYPTENKEGYSVKSNAAAKDDNKHTDSPYDTARDVDFVPCRNYSSNVNKTFIVDTATTGVVKEVVNDNIVIVQNSVGNVSPQYHNILPPCEDKMKKCYEKIDENSREIIHYKYWGAKSCYG